MIFGPKKITAFGLDVSDVNIKVMQLSARKEGFFPLAHAMIDLPANLIVNHMIVDEEKLAQNIARVIKTARHIDTRYVVASVPEAKSFVRILKIPKMDKVEMEGAIPWELEQDIPIPIDQVYMDWQIVAEGPEFQNVLVTATPKDYVDSLVNVLQLAKLKPVAIELESQATARALIGREQGDDPVLIIDMATSLTSFVIVSKGGILEYTSNIPVGGNALTESIARNLGVQTKEAEKIKREAGLLEDSKKGNVRQALLPILDNIVDEIKNVVKFHEDHSLFGKKISKVLLCGGSSQLKGVDEYISARLNVGAGRPIGRVVLGDPWTNVATGQDRDSIPVPKDESLAYATSIGLALRGMRP